MKDLISKLKFDDNRLIRPRADYIGPAYPQHWIPMNQR